MQENNILSKVIEYADKHYDGHFTLMKFTTNWRACFGTTWDRFEIEHMRKGKTMDEALNNLLKDPIDAYQLAKLAQIDKEKLM